MRYNIRVTNKETKTVWYHDGLTKEEIGWIQTNSNLVIEIRSESHDSTARDSRAGKEEQE
jgi:hypothetical protein